MQVRSARLRGARRRKRCKKEVAARTCRSIIRQGSEKVDFPLFKKGKSVAQPTLLPHVQRCKCDLPYNTLCTEGEEEGGGENAARLFLLLSLLFCQSNRGSTGGHAQVGIRGSAIKERRLRGSGEKREPTVSTRQNRGHLTVFRFLSVRKRLASLQSGCQAVIKATRRAGLLRTSQTGLQWAHLRSNAAHTSRTDLNTPATQKCHFLLLGRVGTKVVPQTLLPARVPVLAGGGSGRCLQGERGEEVKPDIFGTDVVRLCSYTAGCMRPYRGPVHSPRYWT